MDRPRLTVVPCTQQRSKDFIRQHHRHHRPPVGAILCLAVVDEERNVRGVATVGRPVARMLDDGLTAEVNRVATDGCPNACSALLGAARRAVFAMGYRRIITYTLPEEGGASLRGAGWELAGEAGGGSWSRNARPCEDNHPTGIKHRWMSTNAQTPDAPIHWPAEPEDTAQLSLIG
jgi:hypothetical protein